MKVLGFGDNIIDRFVDRGIDYPGGNSVNLAVYAQRLGMEAAYMGVFADDALGRFLREAIADTGVAVDRCAVRDGESGVSMLKVDAGDRVFLGWNGSGVTVREPLVTTRCCSTTCRPSTWCTRACTRAARRSCPSSPVSTRSGPSTSPVRRSSGRPSTWTGSAPMPTSFCCTAHTSRTTCIGRTVARPVVSEQTPS